MIARWWRFHFVDGSRRLKYLFFAGSFVVCYGIVNTLWLQREERQVTYEALFLTTVLMLVLPLAGRRTSGPISKTGSEAVPSLISKVAAPSGDHLREESQAITGVVSSFEAPLASHGEFRIKLIQWNVPPGIADEACIIYVILLSNQLAAPTPVHMSGDIEDFERAHGEWRGQDARVLIYFSQRHSSWSQQLRRRNIVFYTFEHVQEFRERLSEHVALFLQEAVFTVESPDVQLLYSLEDSLSFHRAMSELLYVCDTLAVLYLDLDQFKDLRKLLQRTHDVSWSMQRSTGILAALVHQVIDTVGNQGRVFRYAGDELAILVPNRAEKQVLDLAERIRAVVEAHGNYEDCPITASIGVACCPPFAGHELFTRAYEAVYVAKLTGRNRVIAGPLNEDLIGLLASSYERRHS
jgi:diguanylate cyclase (GGDEF)-like protein